MNIINEKIILERAAQKLKREFNLNNETMYIIDNMDIEHPNFIYIEKMITDIAEFINYFLIAIARKKEKINGN